MTDKETEPLESFKEVFKGLIEDIRRQKEKIDELERNNSFLMNIADKQFLLLSKYARYHKDTKGGYTPDIGYENLRKLLKSCNFKLSEITQRELEELAYWKKDKKQ